MLLVILRLLLLFFRNTASKKRPYTAFCRKYRPCYKLCITLDYGCQYSLCLQNQCNLINILDQTFLMLPIKNQILGITSIVLSPIIFRHWSFFMYRGLPPWGSSSPPPRLHRHILRWQPFSASGPVKIILNFSCVNNNSNFSPSCNATEDKWRDKC